MRTPYKAAVLLAFFCLSAFVLKADIFDDVTTALSAGNAHEVARYFDSNVEMMTAEKSSVYSRNQAEIVLNEFLTQNPPKSFTIVHRGSSAKGAQYAIGIMETAQGSFRVYMYVNEIGGKLFIQEIRFDKS